jgi:hypothetical protein
VSAQPRITTWQIILMAVAIQWVAMGIQRLTIDSLDGSKYLTFALYNFSLILGGANIFFSVNVFLHFLTIFSLANEKSQLQHYSQLKNIN